MTCLCHEDGSGLREYDRGARSTPRVPPQVVHPRQLRSRRDLALRPSRVGITHSGHASLDVGARNHASASEQVSAGNLRAIWEPYGRGVVVTTDLYLVENRPHLTRRAVRAELPEVSVPADTRGGTFHE